jgi:hypothetical protein
MKNLISFASVVYLSFFPSIPDGIEAAVDQEIQTRVLRHLHIIPLKTFLPLLCSWYSFGSALLMVFLWLCPAHGIPLALPYSWCSFGSALLTVFLWLCPAHGPLALPAHGVPLTVPCSWYSFGSALLVVPTVSLLLPLILSTFSLCAPAPNIPLSLILTILSHPCS